MVIDPADIDWSLEDDVEVAWAASSGIPQAVAEYHKRGLDKPYTGDDSSE
jgi:hypothetical protein